MNQVLDGIWKGQSIAKRTGDKKCDESLNFELDTHQQKKLIFVP